MAIFKAHWRKPIWVTQGRGELPVTNLSIALALTLMGAGRFSLDNVLGIRMPRALVALVAGVEAALLIIGIVPRPQIPASRSTGGSMSDDTSRTTVTADRSA